MKDLILLVENESNDIRLIQLAFRKLGVLNDLHVVSEGRQAIDYLDGKGLYTDRKRWPLPALVFLDLHLPTGSGFEILSWISYQSHLADIAVIILTDSDNHKEIDEAYHFGASSYLQKTADTAQFGSMLRDLNQFVLAPRHPGCRIKFTESAPHSRSGSGNRVH
jgi:two-component system response regulator